MVVTDEDLASVPLKTVRSIEIEQFVPVDAPARPLASSSRPTTWSPSPSPARPSTCSSRSWPSAGLRAIGKIVLRDREQLVALDPFSSTMLLSTLYWPDEVRIVGELALPEAEVEIKPAERAMAEQLVEAMTGEFDPAAYHDEYREALMAIIEAKAAGAEIAEPAAAPAARVDGPDGRPRSERGRGQSGAPHGRAGGNRDCQGFEGYAQAQARWRPGHGRNRGRPGPAPQVRLSHSRGAFSLTTVAPHKPQAARVLRERS